MKLYVSFDVWLPTAPDHELEYVVAHPELQNDPIAWGIKLREWGYTWPGNRSHLRVVEAA